MGAISHPDPTIETELTVWLYQSQEWVAAVNSRKTNRHETHMAYHVILQAKVGYAFGVTTFTENQLKKVQRAVDVAYRPNRVE